MKLFIFLVSLSLAGCSNAYNRGYLKGQKCAEEFYRTGDKKVVPVYMRGFSIGFTEYKKQMERSVPVVPCPDGDCG